MKFLVLSACLLVLLCSCIREKEEQEQPQLLPAEKLVVEEITLDIR